MDDACGRVAVRTARGCSDYERWPKPLQAGQGEAPALDDHDDRIDQLAGMITSLAQQNAALTAQVSALTGNLKTT